MSVDGYLSKRLAERVQVDGLPVRFIERLNRADFSSGRAAGSEAWAEHNERIHVATVIVAAERGSDAAFDLAALDWRDLLLTAGLADQDWRRRVDQWFSERSEL